MKNIFWLIIEACVMGLLLMYIVNDNIRIDEWTMTSRGCLVTIIIMLFMSYCTEYPDHTIVKDSALIAISIYVIISIIMWDIDYRVWPETLRIIYTTVVASLTCAAGIIRSEVLEL